MNLVAISDYSSRQSSFLDPVPDVRSDEDHGSRNAHGQDFRPVAVVTAFGLGIRLLPLVIFSPRQV